MADIRIKDLATTAFSTAADDFLAVDGTTNGTRKLSAATPSFATSVTVPGVAGPTATDLTLTGGSTGASLVLLQGANGAINITSNGSGSVNVNPGSTGSVNINGASGVGKLAVRTGTNENAHFRTATAIGGTGVGLDMLNDASGATVGFTLRSSATRLTGGNVTVPDGNLLIGTTTDGGQKLQVNGTGYVSGSLTLGSGSGAIAEYLNRGTTAQANLVQWQTAGAANWSVGSGATGTNTNLEFYNHNTASSNFTLNYNTGAATFAGAVTTANGTITANAGTGALTIAGSNTSATGFGAYLRGGSTVGSGKYLLQLVNYDASKNYLFYDDIATFPGAATFAGTVTVGGLCYIGSSSNAGAVILDTPTGSNAQFQMLRGSSIRWNMLRNTATESGSNVGSDWILNRYSDAGADLGVALQVTRSNGVVNISSTTPSTGAGSGALQVAGGIYSGANSYFTGQITSARPFMATGSIAANMTSAGGIGFAGGGANVFSFGANASTTGAFSVQLVSSDASLNFNALTIAANTGAATFAGNIIVAQNSFTNFDGSGVARMGMQAVSVSPYSVRMLGSADSVNTRDFSFGYYTGDNSANAWNQKAAINSYTGAATFAGAVAINNTVATAVAVASTHKVTMVIGGVTYYLLASNV